MLNSIRNFSKTITAKIFLFIVAIPFIFWGMGDVFTSGNKNSLAKINNNNISTEDFINHINKLNINQNLIKDKIDDNILEEILGRLISNKLIELEIMETNLVISDKILAERIKTNSNFIDEDSKFSRTKYEKFLISNNLTANEFEKNFKENEFQEELFNFLGGGIKSPNFLINNIYEQETKEVEVEFINLENIYLKKEQFEIKEIQNYIDANQEKLKRDYIDFSFTKANPKDLVGIDEYNNEFFNKIDEIESKLLNKEKLDDIVEFYKLKSVSRNNYIPPSGVKSIELKIYEARHNESFGLIDEGDFFVFYEIRNIVSRVPELNDNNFENEVRQFLFNKKKFEFNRDILKQINDNQLLDSDLKKIASDKTNVERLLLKSKNDIKKFTPDSLELIYSLSPKSFGLVADIEKNIYLIRILSHKINKISNNEELKDIYKFEANNEIKNKIFQSYDVHLNKKYDIEINEKTLQRVKNYFR